jgi:sugar lactone lactonase YvrE
VYVAQWRDSFLAQQKVEEHMFTVNIPETKVKRAFTTSLCFVVAALVLILSACSTSSNPTTSTGSPSGQQPGDFGLATVPGYQVSLFARQPSGITGPDSLVVDNGFVYIDYQNTTAKDCTDQNTSTVVKYEMHGKMLKTYTVPGHSDGMRADPSTHLLWVTSCEDGNPKFVTIDPTNGTITPYTFPKTPHGGGYDDLSFLNGMVFIAASNPSTNAAGVNVYPAIDKITLSNGKVNLTPVLMGNATATDLIANAKTTLNEVDPDSMTVDTNGDLVLVNQAGSELVFLKNPGTPQQTVTHMPVGDQLDDTVWASSSPGRLLVTDGTIGNTYWINAYPGTVYTQAPDDSGTVGFVGVVNMSTGFATPVVIGFAKATGMIFVPNS